MEYRKVIAARHSVRRFDGQPVDRRVLEEIVAEAGLAPSSRNSKSTGFVILEDRELLGEVALMRDYGSAFLKDAPAAIVVTGDSSKTDLWVDNAAICATYLMLSATDRGLGSCWVHVCGRPRDKEDASKGWAEDYVRDLLALKDGFRPLCIIALGYEAD